MLFFKKKKKDINWLLTDYIVKIEDVVYNQHPDFCDKMGLDKSKKFICLRNYKGQRIYINEKDFDKFSNMDNIYYDNMINLTNLYKYKVISTTYSNVFNMSIPQQVIIKKFKKCRVNNIDVYITSSEELTRADSLFNDLITLKNMKDQHHIK